jgi:hypothetical protein
MCFEKDVLLLWSVEVVEDSSLFDFETDVQHLPAGVEAIVSDAVSAFKNYALWLLLTPYLLPATDCSPSPQALHCYFERVCSTHKKNDGKWGGGSSLVVCVWVNL